MDAQAVSAPSRERLQLLESWHGDWSGIRVAVLGLGETGFSVADTLAELDSQVLVVAEHDDPERARLLEVIGAEHVLARGEREQLHQVTQFDPDLLVVATEIESQHPAVTWAENNGLVVWSDIELGWRLRDKTPHIADWICIAGGSEAAKTADLAAHMLLEGGLRTAPVGGDGPPLLHALRDPQGYDALVLSVSATQLRWSERVSPLASVYIGSAEAVGSPEARSGAQAGHRALRDAFAHVYERTQTACVYHRADRDIEAMVEDADVVEGARAISFGLDSPPPSGFGVVDGVLIDRAFHPERRHEAFEIASVDELGQQGSHTPRLVQHILAAAALARARGVAPETIASAVAKYHTRTF